MKFFGDIETSWPGSDGKHHALVAVLGGWQCFCETRPERYETVEREPKPTTDPVVLKPDRDRIDCKLCKQLLDGKTIDELVEWKQVAL